MIHSRPLQSIKQVILQSQNSKGIEPGFSCRSRIREKYTAKQGAQIAGMIFKHALDAEKNAAKSFLQ